MEAEATQTSASLARQALHQALREQQWRAGEKLPPERELCETLGVKRMSLRQALLALENEGAIFRIDRKGWFVAQPRFIYDPLGHVSFQRAAREQGDASWQDLEQESIVADAAQAADFALDIGVPLLRVFGWGAFNGHRIFVHDVLINCQLAPDYPDKLEGRSFTEVWEQEFNITPMLADLLIRPIRLEGRAQQLLGCTNGAPGLYIKRTKSDGKGRIIQIDREFWRFEALELHFAVKDAT
ncbi:GntR family transcriptional regulator [Marinobacterium sedimentorum]|uniref:GntR family transcriptional regulator n=1 Tax=Marinobacterium sedimentorum TaxID=2927804 RepID=UPI0020C68B62|nr:GntR family transcriptional regulator [Marinobacterium sedimentorum]MCP8687502.1 GntR family transcriptional regulator [Marinobacterium sedimentorum]